MRTLITVLSSILLTIILIYPCNASLSAAPSEAELFEKAYGYYLAYQPDKAIEHFDLFLNAYPDSSAKDSALFWKAKSLMQINRTNDAKKIFEEIRADFPESYFRAFAEKEIESIAKGGAPKIQESKDTADLTDIENKMPELAEKNRELEMRLAESQKKHQLTEKGLSRALEDKNSLEEKLEELKRKNEEFSVIADKFELLKADSQKIIEENKKLSAGIKEKEEKIKDLIIEIEGKGEKLNLLNREKEESAARIEFLEQREMELNLVLSKLREKQKDWEELDKYLNRLKEDKLALENQIKIKDMELSEAGKSVLSLENRIKGFEQEMKKDRQQSEASIAKLSGEKARLEDELKKEQKRARELSLQGDKAEALMKELKTLEESNRTLEARLEKDRKQHEAELQKLRHEKELLDGRLEELSRKDTSIKDLTAKLRQQESKYNEMVNSLNKLQETRISLEKDLEEKGSKLKESEKTIALIDSRVRELQKANREEPENTKKTITKLEHEKTLLEEALEKERKKLSELTTQNMEKEKIIKELRAIQDEMHGIKAGAESYKMKTEGELNKLRNEKELLKEKLKDLEGLQKDTKNLSIEIKEQRSKFKDTENSLNRLKEDKLALENQIKIKDMELSEAGKSVLSLENRIKGFEQEMKKDRQQSEASIAKLSGEKARLEDELKKEQKRARELSLQGDKAEALMKELKTLEESNRTLEARLEKDRKQHEAELQKLRHEKELLDGRLEELSRKDTSIKDLTAKLRQQEKRFKDSEDLIRKLSEETRSYEMKLREKETIIASLNELDAKFAPLKRYDVPVVGLGDKKYTLLQIFEESLSSSKVLSKMNLESVAWRSGKVLDDFVIEQILYKTAKDEGIKENKSAFDSISRKYSFDNDEKKYLAKYLLISELIKKKSAAASSVNENEAKEYYEKNKDKYLITGPEKKVILLSISYSSGDEFEKAVIASELHQKAGSGISLESLHRSYGKLLGFKQIKFEELPDWIQQKIRGLKDGEISNVISTGDRFVIIQTQFVNPAYKKYEDVRSEIIKNYFSGRQEPYGNLREWLKEIRKEAVEIK
ncbi:MAG: peptidyl-prolyl cis-trans isomerase [Nitrospirota bacterium]